MEKIQIPIFEGKDVYGWAYQFKMYFVVNELIEEEKLMVDVLCLERKVSAWFQ